MLRQGCCYADDLDKIRCVEKRLPLTARTKVVFLVGGATELSKIKRKTVEKQCNTHAWNMRDLCRAIVANLPQRTYDLYAIFIECAALFVQEEENISLQRALLSGASIKRSSLMHRARKYGSPQSTRYKITKRATITGINVSSHHA